MTSVPRSYDEEFVRLALLARRASFRVLGNYADAEDVAAETMTRAYFKWPRIQTHLEPWVVRVAVNLSLDRLRRTTKPLTRVKHSVPSPEDEVVGHAETRDLLRKLPTRQRQVVALTVLADLTHGSGGGGPEDIARLRATALSQGAQVAATNDARPSHADDEGADMDSTELIPPSGGEPQLSGNLRMQVEANVEARRVRRVRLLGASSVLVIGIAAVSLLSIASGGDPSEPQTVASEGQGAAESSEPDSPSGVRNSRGESTTTSSSSTSAVPDTSPEESATSTPVTTSTPPLATTETTAPRPPAPVSCGAVPPTSDTIGLEVHQLSGTFSATARTIEVEVTNRSDGPITISASGGPSLDAVLIDAGQTLTTRGFRRGSAFVHTIEPNETARWTATLRSSTCAQDGAEVAGGTYEAVLLLPVAGPSVRMDPPVVSAALGPVTL